jgi:hypothetical protein
MTIEPIWSQVRDEVKKFGFGVSHSEASWNRELSRTLGINTVPYVVGILNGKVFHFRNEFTMKNLRDFVRKMLPSNLIVEDLNNEKSFNSTLHDTILYENKAFALFIDHKDQASLKYQMPCFQQRTFVKCAHLKLGNTIGLFCLF